MSDAPKGPAGHTRHYLRRIDEVVGASREDMRELKVRMTSVEHGLAAFNQTLALQSRRIERVEVRLERIEGRLDIVEHG
jgi:uncharacterized coiled-coil protein SlyX